MHPNNFGVAPRGTMYYVYRAVKLRYRLFLPTVISINYQWIKRPLSTFEMASFDFVLRRLLRLQRQSATLPDIQQTERITLTQTWTVLGMAAGDCSHRTPSVNVAWTTLETRHLRVGETIDPLLRLKMSGLRPLSVTYFLLALRFFTELFLSFSCVAEL